MTISSGGLLGRIFDRALARPIATSGWRDKTFATAYLLSSDFNTSLAIVPLVKNFRSVVRLISTINKIDDNVDQAKPYDVALADFGRNQNGESNFLHDRRFVPQEYLRVLGELDKGNVVGYDTSITYSNIFCAQLQDRAQHQIRMSNDRDPELRLNIMNNNLTISAVYGCYIFGMLSPAKNVDPENITATNLQKIYPEIYPINHAAQILDDLRDVMLDLEDEMTTGNPSPNTILCNTLECDTDYSILYGFAHDVRKREEIVPEDVPAILKDGIKRAGELFSADMDKVRSVGSRAILESFWRNTARETIKTSLHPEVRRKEQIHAREHELIL